VNHSRKICMHVHGVLISIAWNVGVALRGTKRKRHNVEVVGGL